MVALGILLILVSLLLIGIVLIQKGRGGGLSGAFGGGSQAFGTRTGDALTWATIVLTVLFLSLTITMTLVARHSITRGTVNKPTYRVVSEPKDKGYAMISLDTDTIGAAIYYTLDGKEPTKESETYDSKSDNTNKALGVKVNLDQTIKARGFRPGWDASEVMKYTYDGKKASAVVPVAPIVPIPAPAPGPNTPETPVPAAPVAPTTPAPAPATPAPVAPVAPAA